MNADASELLRPSSVPIANLYYLICYAFDAPESALRRDVGEQVAPHPVDLIALLLLDEVDRLLKRGLSHGYVEEREDLPGVRGRLDFGESTRRLLFETGRAACVFTNYVTETAPNQVLATTLERLTRDSRLSKTLALRARRLRPRVPACASFPWRSGAFDEVRAPRNARGYAFALNLCRVLVNDALPDTSGDTGSFGRFDGDGRWLGNVFERFALRFWQREAEFIRTQGQHNRPWTLIGGTPANAAYLPQLQTDIEFVTDAGHTIVESKCYQSPLKGYRHSRKLRPSHVNQLFAYVSNARARDERVAGGMLLYAQVTEPLHVDLEWAGVPIRVRSVNLGSRWEVTRDQMLAIARTVAGDRRPLRTPSSPT